MYASLAVALISLAIKSIISTVLIFWNKSPFDWTSVVTVSDTVVKLFTPLATFILPASLKRTNSPFPTLSAVLVLVSEGISVTSGTLA